MAGATPQVSPVKLGRCPSHPVRNRTATHSKRAFSKPRTLSLPRCPSILSDLPAGHQHGRCFLVPQSEIRNPKFRETPVVFDSIAIVGATGAVGQLIRNMLEERDFPHEKITFLA